MKPSRYRKRRDGMPIPSAPQSHGGVDRPVNWSVFGPGVGRGWRWRALGHRHRRHRPDALSIRRHRPVLAHVLAMARHRLVASRIAKHAGDVIDVGGKTLGSRGRWYRDPCPPAPDRKTPDRKTLEHELNRSRHTCGAVTRSHSVGVASSAG